MRKSITKIISILLIVGMNWTGLAAVFGTRAYFSDTEVSSGNSMAAANSFGAGSLSFSLTAPGGGAIAEFPALAPDKSSVKEVVLTKTGTLGFDYVVKIPQAPVENGGTDVCGYLQLTGILNGTPVFVWSMSHAGSFDLNNYIFGPKTYGTAADEWEFVASFISVNDEIGAKCDFDLEFVATNGFTSSKSITNSVEVGGLAGSAAGDFVRLNEFLPNPSHGHQWVELYNLGDDNFDLNGWHIQSGSDNIAIDASSTDNILYSANNDTVIYGADWFVVDVGHSIGLGEEIGLFDNLGNPIDSYIYTAAEHGSLEQTMRDWNQELPGDEVLPDKSYARIPDGVGEWVDPDPTPGGPNRLSEAEIEDAAAEETAAGSTSGADTQEDQSIGATQADETGQSEDAGQTEEVSQAGQTEDGGIVTEEEDVAAESESGQVEEDDDADGGVDDSVDTDTDTDSVDQNEVIDTDGEDQDNEDIADITVDAFQEQVEKLGIADTGTADNTDDNNLGQESDNTVDNPESEEDSSSQSSDNDEAVAVESQSGKDSSDEIAAEPSGDDGASDDSGGSLSDEGASDSEGVSDAGSNIE